MQLQGEHNNAIRPALAFQTGSSVHAVLPLLPQPHAGPLPSTFAGSFLTRIIWRIWKNQFVKVPRIGTQVPIRGSRGGGANYVSLGCTTALTSLSPCLNYVMGSSSTPSASCCSQLSSVVQSSPQCLCSLLNGGGSSFGLTINQTLALSLPVACKVQTPPVSQCNAGNGPTSPNPSTAPVGSPVSSPSDSSTESPEGSITPPALDFPSGAGSKSVPSTDGGSSDGSTIKVPFHLVLYLLAIVSSVTKF